MRVSGSNKKILCCSSEIMGKAQDIHSLAAARINRDEPLEDCVAAELIARLREASAALSEVTERMAEAE